MRVEPSADDYAVVHLKVQRARVMRYLSGQRATVRFDGVPPCETWLVSCPCDAVNLRIHVRVMRVEPSADDYAVVHLKVQRARVMRYLSGPAGDDPPSRLDRGRRMHASSGAVHRKSSGPIQTIPCGSTSTDHRTLRTYRKNNRPMRMGERVWVG